MNYFEVFGIKPNYFISLEQVTKKFYELSRVLHPDKFQTKSVEDILEATRQSAVLNSAFKVLRDDDERAQYLFELAKFNLAETKKSLPPELAEEYFNLQEVLENDGKNNDEAKTLMKNFAALLEKQLQTQEELQLKAFKDWEAAQSPLDEKAVPFFTRAHQALMQKSYIRSMAQDLEKKWPM